MGGASPGWGSANMDGEIVSVGELRNPTGVRRRHPALEGEDSVVIQRHARRGASVVGVLRLSQPNSQREPAAGDLRSLHFRVLDLDLQPLELIAKRRERLGPGVDAWHGQDRGRRLLAGNQYQIDVLMIAADDLPGQINLDQCRPLLRRQHIEPEFHAAQRIVWRQHEVAKVLQPGDALREEVPPVARLSQPALVLQRLVDDLVDIDLTVLGPRAQLVRALAEVPIG